MRTDWTYDLDAGLLKAVSIGARYDRVDSEQNPLRADIRPAGGIPATALSPYVTMYSNSGFARRRVRRRAALVSRRQLRGDQLLGVRATSRRSRRTCSASIRRNNTNAFVEHVRDQGALHRRVRQGRLTTRRLGASALTGNVGVRYVNRELESIGNQIAPTGGATPSTFERTDDDWLPSAVAKLELNDDLIFRLGAARVIAYPNTVDLNSGVTLANNAVFVGGVQTQLGTGTGGAPDLDPFKADQVDLAAEYYFGEQALVSLGLFYKDVSTFIIQQQSPRPTAASTTWSTARSTAKARRCRAWRCWCSCPSTSCPVRSTASA